MSGWLMVMIYILPVTSSTNFVVRVNNDSSTNYATRRSSNGAADVTGTPQSFLFHTGLLEIYPFYLVFWGRNELNREKLFIGEYVKQEAGGAGTAPSRIEECPKWANTTAQINRVDAVEYNSANNFAGGSVIIVLGAD